MQRLEGVSCIIMVVLGKVSLGLGPERVVEEVKEVRYMSYSKIAQAVQSTIRMSYHEALWQTGRGPKAVACRLASRSFTAPPLPTWTGIRVG